jgi:hypothetical protein
LLTVNLALLSPMSPTSGDMGHPDVVSGIYLQ